MSGGWYDKVGVWTKTVPVLLTITMRSSVPFAIIVLIISVVSALYVIIGQLFEDALRRRPAQAQTDHAPTVQCDLVVKIRRPFSLRNRSIRLRVLELTGNGITEFRARDSGTVQE